MYKKFCDYLQQNVENSNCVHVGVAEAISKTQNPSTFLNHSHNLIGEPELPIWTSIPQNLTVDVNPSSVKANVDNYIEVKINNLIITKEATICLYKKNEVIATKNVIGDKNGTASAIFENIEPTTEGDLFVTVIANNSIPNETVIPVEKECTIFVTGDEKWNTDKIVSCNVVVEDGAILTITNKVLMYSEASITVQAGGKLILDGGKFTTIYDELWKGIQVQGDPYLACNPAYQGCVVIKNGGSIENALVGIDVSENYIPSKSIDKAQLRGGGMVTATDAVFKNNKVSVKFEAAFKANKSIFTNCTFITDEAMIAGQTPDYFMKLNGVEGVQVLGSDFDNQTGVDRNGNGIYCYNSSIKVDGRCESLFAPCTQWDNSTFSNLRYGIYNYGGYSTAGVLRVSNTVFNNNYYGINAKAGNNTRSVYVDACEFTDQYRAMMLIGYQQSTEITSNVFNMNRTVSIAASGLWMEDCCRYHIENNDFNATTLFSCTGLYLKNSGSVHNEVYNNRFDKLQYASVAEGNNRDGSDGLCFVCNDYSDCKIDIYVAGNTTTTTQGIAQIQAKPLGSVIEGAANTFTSNSARLKNIVNSSNWFTYYHHSDIGLDKLKPDDEPGIQDGLSLSNMGGVYEKAVTCPSKLNSGGGSGLIVGAKSGKSGEDINYYLDPINQAVDSVNLIQQMLASAIDGGNTQAQINAINTTTTNNVITTCEQLLSHSPYISDTVVKVALDKESCINNAMIRDLMVANPHNASSMSIREKLDQRTNPMPEYMVEQIDNVVGEDDATSELLKKSAQYQQQVDEYYQMMIHDYVIDSMLTETGYSQLLEALPMLAAKYQRVFYLIDQKEFVLAQNLLATILNDFNLDNMQVAEHQAYSELVSLIIDCQENGRLLNELSDTDVALLTDLTNRGNMVPAVYARGILVSAGLLDYDPVLDITIEEGLKQGDNMVNQPAKEEEQLLQIMPNPAHDYFTVVYHNTGKGSAQLMVYTLQGQPVLEREVDLAKDQVVIKTTGWAKGTYLLQLVAEGKVIEHKKVTIVQ